MIHLHYLPGSASMAPHLVLEELGLPYQLAKIDKEGGQMNSAAYRKLNPNGLTPVLVDGDLVLYESAAICLHLADSRPEVGLLPEVGSAGRGHAYKWMSWLSTTVQPALLLYFYPERWTDTPEATAQLKAHAETRVMALMGQLDAQLASHGGPWLLGESFSVPDLYAMMLCRWTRGFAGAKATDLPHILPWLGRVTARPAVRRVFAQEDLPLPWF